MICFLNLFSNQHPTMSKPNNNVSLSRNEDHDLMQRIAERDEEAFHEFERKYRKLIYTTARKVLSNHQDAQDVTNEVLIKIWKNAHAYQMRKGTLVTWICTTTRNRSIDHIRSVNRRLNLYEGYKTRTEVDSSADYECGLTPIVGSEIREILLKEVNKLPENQKDAVVLFYLYGLTQRQVAEKLKQPLGTIKARLKRAVEKLRHSFDPGLLEEFASLP